MLKLLVVVAILAVLIYTTARVIQRRGIKAPERPQRRPRPRPVAPDDDPDFLRDLDRKRKHPEDPEAP